MKISREELQTENEEFLIMAETFNKMLDKVEKLNMENINKERLRAEADYNMRIAQMKSSLYLQYIRKSEGHGSEGKELYFIGMSSCPVTDAQIQPEDRKGKK